MKKEFIGDVASGIFEEVDKEKGQKRMGEVKGDKWSDKNTIGFGSIRNNVVDAWNSWLCWLNSADNTHCDKSVQVGEAPFIKKHHRSHQELLMT